MIQSNPPDRRSEMQNYPNSALETFNGYSPFQTGRLISRIHKKKIGDAKLSNFDISFQQSKETDIKFIKQNKNIKVYENQTNLRYFVNEITVTKLLTILWRYIQYKVVSNKHYDMNQNLPTSQLRSTKYKAKL